MLVSEGKDSAVHCWSDHLLSGPLCLLAKKFGRLLAA